MTPESYVLLRPERYQGYRRVEFSQNEKMLQDYRVNYKMYQNRAFSLQIGLKYMWYLSQPTNKQQAQKLHTRQPVCQTSRCLKKENSI
jgi:hypothetical protein